MLVNECLHEFGGGEQKKKKIACQFRLAELSKKERERYGFDTAPPTIALGSDGSKMYFSSSPELLPLATLVVIGFFEKMMRMIKVKIKWMQTQKGKQ